MEIDKTTTVLELEEEARRRTWPNLWEVLENHMSSTTVHFESKDLEKVVGRKKLQTNSRRFYTLAKPRTSSQTASNTA